MIDLIWRTIFIVLDITFDTLSREEAAAVILEREIRVVHRPVIVDVPR